MIPSVTKIEPAAQAKGACSIPSSATSRVRRLNNIELSRQPLFQRDLTVAVCALVHRACFLGCQAGPHHVVFVIRQRDVPHLANQRWALLEIEVEEAAH